MAHGVGFAVVVVVGSGRHADGLRGVPGGGGKTERGGADRDRRVVRGSDGHRHVSGWNGVQPHRILHSGRVLLLDDQSRSAKGDVLAVGIDHVDHDRRCFDRVVVRTGDGVGDGCSLVDGVVVHGGGHPDRLGDIPVRGGEGERCGAEREGGVRAGRGHGYRSGRRRLQAHPVRAGSCTFGDRQRLWAHMDAQAFVDCVAAGHACGFLLDVAVVLPQDMELRLGQSDSRDSPPSQSRSSSQTVRFQCPLSRRL